MRLLFTSTAGAGHFGPLAPFIRSCVRGGHEAMVAAPAALASTVAATGAAFWSVDDPPQERLAAVFGRLDRLSHEEANALIIGEVFARLDAGAALPKLREIVGSWQPDFVIRESAEFGGAVAAELHGVPHVRVGIGLSEIGELVIRLASSGIDELRRSCGLDADDGEALRAEPVFTLFPAGLENPAFPAPKQTWRFRDPQWETFGAQVSNSRPFVYVTFGSVAGAIPQVASVYSEALEAVDGLDADVLLTIGRDADPGRFGTLPPNVRVEPWVDQAEILGRAAAVVCHGGGGTVLGTLAAGVPVVVAPLFAEDQHINARRVAACGAGVHVTPDATAIRNAVTSVLSEPSYRDTAQALAAELASHPSTDESVAALTSLK